MAKGNVGDRIRVVDADGSSEYMNGDEGVIVQTEKGCSGADIRFEYHTEGDCDYLMGSEYEIIQQINRNPTEETKQGVISRNEIESAKAGDVVICIADEYDTSGNGITHGEEYVILGVQEPCSYDDRMFVICKDDGENTVVYSKRFKLKEKGIEGQKIEWAIGQEVFCLLRGKGVVSSVQSNQSLWECGVTAIFEKHGQIRYNLDGKIAISMNRSLFFSEPQIFAETMPPKKPFIPVLKKGDIVFAEYPDKVFKITVEQENEDSITSSQGVGFTKKGCVFYKLGDKVEFNV